jgi:hypothetical protein
MDVSQITILLLDIWKQKDYIAIIISIWEVGNAAYNKNA